MADYIAYLHKDKDTDFGVSFPDFPGCLAAGSTLEEARTNAVEALGFHIEGMIEDGDAIPEPSSLDAVAADPDLQGGMIVLVSAEIPGRTVRFNVTAKEAQLETIDRQAQAAGMSRSAFLVQAALRNANSQMEKRAASKRKTRHHAVA